MGKYINVWALLFLSTTWHNPFLTSGFSYISFPTNQQFAGNWPVSTPYPQKPLILHLLEKNHNHHFFTTGKHLINALVNTPIIPAFYFATNTENKAECLTLIRGYPYMLYVRKPVLASQKEQFRYPQFTLWISELSFLTRKSWLTDICNIYPV